MFFAPVLLSENKSIRNLGMVYKTRKQLAGAVSAYFLEGIRKNETCIFLGSGECPVGELKSLVSAYSPELKAAIEEKKVLFYDIYSVYGFGYLPDVKEIIGFLSEKVAVISKVKKMCRIGWEVPLSCINDRFLMEYAYRIQREECFEKTDICCFYNAGEVQSYVSEMLFLQFHQMMLWEGTGKTYDGGGKNCFFIFDTFYQIFEALNALLDYRDPYTASHQRNVKDIVAEIGILMGIDRFRIEGLKFAALVHDIGKIVVPSEILHKPGMLSKTEFDLIRNHVSVGHEILKGVVFPWPVHEFVYQHHERWDGSGYPFGISGTDISLEARILGVADVVDAMLSHRPYRPSLRPDDVLKELKEKREILYDPDVVEAILGVFDSIVCKYQNDSCKS